MPIITLTSDWIENDYYVAKIKGRLLSAAPAGLQIVDINHRIKAFNSKEAAFVVRNAYPSFPEGSIHLIAVNTETEKGRPILAARKDGHYFLCADNGILGLLGGEKPDLVVALPQPEPGEGLSFLALTVLTEAALALLSGSDLENLGEVFDKYQDPVALRAIIDKSSISGKVIYIDSYQNAITNVSQELFERVGKGAPFQIYVQSKYYRIGRLSQSYNQVDEGDLLPLFNSLGLLEIAIRSGHAAKLLKLTTDSSIRVEFKEVKHA